MGARARLRGRRFTPADPFPRSTLMTSPNGRRMVRPYILTALAVGLLVVRTISAAPGFWQTATQADFLRGEVEQLSIDEHGRVTLGPELTKVHDAGAPFVWTLLAGADGAWFLGTGNDGKVLR